MDSFLWEQLQEDETLIATEKLTSKDHGDERHKKDTTLRVKKDL